MGGNIMTRRWMALFLFCFVLLAACQPAAEQVAIPTLMVLPSATITDTPSSTPVPTLTETPTETLTPSLSPTFTDTPSSRPAPTDTPTTPWTPSLTATLTLTPSKTPLPTLTPSATLTPTRTNTRTPRPTRTPVPTATPTFTATAVAQIISFGADVTTITSGASIRLAWTAVADLVRIEQLNQDSVVTQTFPALPASGVFTVVVPSNQGRVVQYRLVASRVGVEVSQTVPISIICTASWFFGDQAAPPGTGCPAAVGAIASGAFQRFERGLMIYVTANGLNRVYGLQNDQALYIGVSNGWDGSTLNTTPAPSGFYMPEQMFNWVYYNTLAPIGGWNSALGWGTTPIDSGQRTIQWEGSIGGSSPFFIDAPNGEVYHFSGGDSGTWFRVK
jgi:hypothetical protein